ncbi:CdaR family transcriptional regulator [Aeromicrobium sp. 50.2.37]|uniref:PucR family transcriptional regulator n=1 Tax=Aeromicrobium sp. 50.2.37 TaxID=2969305 RepID=UPI00214F6F47|nr:helix-turn-helix domain-containing protein [Aeromicrobium sp. 50.2.37]MCR4514677.1 helix-turn-helix domain-containing protein [Aeromicrobium sp. 50.2.37]
MLSLGDDLFSLADSLSQLLGAPVTIEDRDAAVIAYSDGQDAVDDARIETILDRKVPANVRQALADAGVFDAIAEHDDVQYFELPHLSMTPRAVIAVRHRTVLVGSIWMLTDSGPTEEQRHILTTAAPIVAKAIASRRVRRDDKSSTSRRHVTALLAGGEEAAQMAHSLRLDAPMSVAAIRAVGPDTDPTGAVQLHLKAVLRRVACARIAHTTYAVICADPSLTADILTTVQERLGNNAQPVSVGLGRSVVAARDLDLSRTDADLLLDSMRRRGDVKVVARPDTHYTTLLIDHARQFVRNHRGHGPLARLSKLGAEAEQMRETLTAYLDCNADIAKTATVLFVHPNTVRNRLRRLMAACELDIEDPQTRLALWVELNVERSQT